MNNTDLLNALDDITVLDTVQANGATVGLGCILIIFGILTIVFSVSSIFMIDGLHHRRK